MVNSQFQNSIQKQIRSATNIILNCNDDIGLMKSSVDRMYALYTTLTQVTVENQNDASIFTSSGKAISPSVAAFCLLDMKRTAIFLRGIHLAIQNKNAEKKGKPIIILYAGTGPYAALVTPLLTCWTPDEVVVDLLDINPVSLDSAKKVMTKLGLSQFIGSVYLADAAEFKMEKKYDIVISETMQAALKKEPQVAIMQNLIPQMDEDSVFIPEAISIDAALVSKGRWDSENIMFSGRKAIPLVNLFTVGRHSYKAEKFRGTIAIPAGFGACNQLKIYTTIRVFGEVILSEGDCMLNAPAMVCELADNGTKKFHFRYETGDLPGIFCKFEEPAMAFKMTGKTYG